MHRTSIPGRNLYRASGKRSSVRLEDEFWDALKWLAECDGRRLEALCREIDRDRRPDQSLTSAIRVYVVVRLTKIASAGTGRRTAGYPASRSAGLHPAPAD